MESKEFDAVLGGTEHLPNSANSLKFAASRSVEIAAITECILRPSKTKLIFQSLPVHMRRRVMSHNCKRLPRKLRDGHMEQLKKSGLAPKLKKPSRKYRRRPTNLLEEYSRRQKRITWLETHIWHAKRFHMIERWNHSLAHRPCDKAFRACYRASSAHCLLLDNSYYIPIEITGPEHIIKEMFSSITHSPCGLGICAKAYITGKREGSIHLYQPHQFPFGYIAKAQFIWVEKNNATKKLLLFIHPSQVKQVESVLSDIICSSSQVESITKDNDEVLSKKRKLSNIYSALLKINVLGGAFNRFSLIGPKSQAILAKSLKCVKSTEKIQNNAWVSKFLSTPSNLQEKYEFWSTISSADSPSQLPPRLVLGLIVKDPRLSRPQKRIKAQGNSTTQINIEALLNIPSISSQSPIWEDEVRNIIKNKKITNAKFIEHITKTQLLPGEVNEDDSALQSIPIVLIQRPGTQNARCKKIGFGSGWDIIIPAGYGLPFWLTFIMFGGRSGGLREIQNLAFEMGECYLPPDSEAGSLEEKREATELKEKYFKKPPSKRINYMKLGIVSPFSCPWDILLRDWSNDQKAKERFFVLRDKKIILDVEECCTYKKEMTQIENADSCLVTVYLQIQGKGCINNTAIICLPEQGDMDSLKTLCEEQHEDPNEKLRKQKRQDHKKYLKQKKKKSIKLRKGADMNKQQTKKRKPILSEYVKTMRELWLPSKIDSIRYTSKRQIIGFISQGAFSFSEAKCCGIGYVAYNALTALVKSGLNKVLVRNTSSRKYRLASIQLIKQ